MTAPRLPGTPERGPRQSVVAGIGRAALAADGWRRGGRWLPPTRANLALLTVRIPPGFTQVHTP